MSTRRPEEIVGVTLNHLQSLRNVRGGTGQIVAVCHRAAKLAERVRWRC